MERTILNQLLEWKDSPNRKPLILKGARQVGKTWVLKEFGKKHFKHTAYIMFEQNPNMQQLFEGKLSPEHLIPFLQAESGVPFIPQETLIIFDEIQSAPKAVTSLKFFEEQAPEYAVVAAGSSLGVTLHEGTSFPVGKTDFLQLFPMNFVEFLMANGESDLAALIQKSQDLSEINAFHEKLEKYFRQYLFIGGMPEVVKTFSDTQNFTRARQTQKRLLTAYEEDFSKHTNNLLASKIRQLWESIPQQISRENRKFIFGAIKTGAKGRDYEFAIKWLQDSSLVYKISRVNSVQEPLKTYQDVNAFKLFMHDVGLLGAQADVQPRAILDDTKIYKEFKGALAEQYVAQELTAGNVPLYYWSSNDAKQEIDFLIENSQGIIPIEVKSGRSLNSKSFARFMDNSKSPYGYKISAKPFAQSDQVINLPLYLTFKIAQPAD
jgi:predicted AAA+ superfamily ATPase